MSSKRSQQGTAKTIAVATIWIASISGCTATVHVDAIKDQPGADVLFSARAKSAELPPLPSRGCSLPPEAQTRADPPGIIVRHVSSDGHQRRFLLALPDGPRGKPLPLVLNLHGLAETPEEQQLFTGMQPLALARGWAIAWPEGLGFSWNAGACCGRARADESDDVQFMRDLVAQLAREMCLDLRRVYATGMSNGGFMSYRLACDASDLFAAVAPVAGVEGVQSCAPKRPMPILAINGTSDHLVPYEGRNADDFPSVKETLSRWKKRDGCEGPNRIFFENGDIKCESPTGCKPNGDLIYCAVEGGGHTWPGGMLAPYLGKTSSALDASAAILDFFSAHARE